MLIAFQYCLNIETRLSSLNANLWVSTPFNKEEVIEDITHKLSEINYLLDFESLKFVIRENQLHVEGMAYEQPPPPEFTYDFI